VTTDEDDEDMGGGVLQRRQVVEGPSAVPGPSKPGTDTDTAEARSERETCREAVDVCVVPEERLRREQGLCLCDACIHDAATTRPGLVTLNTGESDERRMSRSAQG
jgi:hypothetical protein